MLFLAEPALELLPEELVFLSVTVASEPFLASSPILKSTREDALDFALLPNFDLKGLKKPKDPFLETSVISIGRCVLFLRSVDV